jgi:hypothetical protein
VLPELREMERRPSLRGCTVLDRAEWDFGGSVLHSVDTAGFTGGVDMLVGEEAN